MSIIIYEPINVINTRLKDHYGFMDEKVKFRLTWPDNEFEIRNQNFTPEGIQLTQPKPQRIHKYVKYLHGFWVLERLSEVPVINLNNLPDNVLSYEPIYHFYEIDKENRKYIAKQPAWMPIKFLVDTLLGNMNAAKIFTKYKHPTAGKSQQELLAEDIAELDEIEAYLTQDETSVGDALSHRYGVTVPRNYERQLTRES